MGLPGYVSQTMSHVTCCQCAMLFSMPQRFNQMLRETKKDFYCPAGHIQGYYGENDAERLKKQVERLQKEKEWAQQATRIEEQRARSAERKERLAKTREKKLKARIQAGVCPCCHRTVSQMAKHIATKHPDYKP